MKDITFSQLFGMALLQIALNSSNSQLCWFSWKEERLHRTIFELQKKYRGGLKSLQKLHFATMGAYPYSSDLKLAMDLMIQSGMIKWETPNDDQKFRRTVNDDSQKFLDTWKLETFEGDPETREVFDSFVQDLENFLKLVPK